MSGVVSSRLNEKSWLPDDDEHRTLATTATRHDSRSVSAKTLPAAVWPMLRYPPAVACAVAGVQPPSSHASSPEAGYAMITPSSDSFPAPTSASARIASEGTKSDSNDTAAMEKGAMETQQVRSHPAILYPTLSSTTPESAPPRAIDRQPTQWPQQVHDEEQVYSYSESLESDHLSLESRAPRILLFLSFVTPILSLISCFWAIIVLAFLTLTSPVRICITLPTLNNQVITSLSPLHRLHLRLVYSSTSLRSDTYIAHKLILVHLAGPFISAAVAVATWVAASFWLYAAILGDPDGKDRKNDGRAAVMGVRNWWEGILCHAFR
ncbi:MAG: hypothetical protein M1833_006637 [Piccolia ochrophora]|nr:MAG: hypothetical protein M1833_006637 [Piccolia ochrophora]